MSTDELHASYSRNLANQSVQKGLIKFAKDRGLQKPEIWSHNGSWALRYTGGDGEIKQLTLGDVFAKARSVIASLGGQKTLAEPAQVQAAVKELLSKAKAVGLATARVDFDGKNFRMNYGGKVYNLGPSRGDAMIKIGKVRPVKASLGGQKVALSTDVRTLKPRIIKILDKAQGQMRSQLVKGMQSVRPDMSSKAVAALESLVKKAESMYGSVQASQSDDGREAGMSLAADPKQIQAWEKELLSKAKAMGLATARIDWTGTAWRMNYGGKVYNLGPSRGDALVKIGKVKPVKTGLSLSTPLQRLNALSLSEVSYNSGWYVCAEKRLGKTESEATEKLSAK